MWSVKTELDLCPDLYRDISIGGRHSPDLALIPLSRPILPRSVPVHRREACVSRPAEKGDAPTQVLHIYTSQAVRPVCRLFTASSGD
jgi:hypothetical protein